MNYLLNPAKNSADWKNNIKKAEKTTHCEDCKHLKGVYFDFQTNKPIIYCSQLGELLWEEQKHFCGSYWPRK